MNSHSSNFQSGASRFRNHSAALILLALIASTVPSLAVDGTWTQTSGGSWSDTENWQSSAIASGSGSIATFNGVGTTVNLDGNRTAGQLNFGGSGTWTISGTGILTLDGGATTARIATDTGVTASITSAVTGTGGFVKDGAGMLAFGGSNTYTGTTEVKAGILSATAAQISGAALALTGGTLHLSSQAQTFTKAISVSGTTNKIIFLRGSNTLTGTVSGASDAVLSFSAGDRAAAALTIRSDFSSYSGTVVLAKPSDGFTYRLDSSSSLASGKNSVWQLDSGTTLLYNAGSNFETTVIELGGLQGSGNLSGGATLGSGSIAYQIGNRGGNTTFSGTIVDGSTKARVIKVGAGSLALSGANTYTGTTIVSAGILSAQNAGALGNGSAVTVNGGALQSTVANVNTGAISLSSGSISANGAGVGSYTLSSTSNFSATGGTISLGLNGTGAGNYDRILGSGGTFSLTNAVLDLSSVAVADYSATYQLFSGFTSGTVTNLTITGYNTGSYLANLSNTGLLSFTATAVPEPTSMALLGLGVGVTVLRRKRRAGI